MRWGASPAGALVVTLIDSNKLAVKLNEGNFDYGCDDDFR